MKFLLLLLSLIAAPAWAGQDDDFLAARDAFRAGNAAKLDSYAKRLKDSPLKIYLDYYQLRMNLETADVELIQSYLSRPDDTPLIDKMRAEWLRLLGKKQQWDRFDREYPRLLNDDVELSCYALQSRQRHDEQAVMREIRNLWFTGKELPQSCAPLFDAALAGDVITQDDIWQRLRLSIEASNVTLARYLADKLTGSRSLSSSSLASAMSSPDRYLERLSLNPSDEGERTLALFALLRLAKQSPELAFSRWNKIATKFPETEKKYFFGWLGYEAARKHDARAMAWFREAGNTPLNEYQSAWRVRAALREQNWPEVLATINAMADSQRQEDVWQYWQGRALQAMGRKVEAEKIFVPLSAGYDFYGQMAAEELAGTAVLSAAQPVHHSDKKLISSIEKLPGVKRTVALYRMDLRTDALREWIWVIRNFNDRELLAAAEIAKGNEMYDRAINTAEKTVHLHDFDLRYLAPYRSALREHIKENELEEAWVYGLMRQESRFITSARSGVGAAGLMQVMPATARWIARKLGLKHYRDSLLHQLDTNLKLGTYYMKNMLSSLDDSPVLASAGYNAGPGRAKRWRADTTMEGAIYAETIPFDETRDYVKKVMSNTVYYARQFGDPPRSLKQRVGTIAGKSGSQSVDSEP